MKAVDSLSPGSKAGGTGEAVRVSVVIVTHDDRENLLRCLQSLVGQSFPAEAMEILVVDDGSTDGTAEAVGRKYPGVRVMVKANEGADISRNTGVEQAASEIIAFIDSDCTAGADWLERLVGRVESKERVVVGGRVEHRGSLWQRLTGIADFGEYQGLRERVARSLPTCNLGVPRELARVEPFDPSLARAGGDTVFTERLRRGGVELLYAPEVVVQHRPDVGAAEFFERGRRYGCSFVTARRVDPHLRYGTLVRLGAVGVIAAAVARVAVDCFRVFRHRRAANIRVVELPVAIVLLGLRRLVGMPAALRALTNGND